MLECTTLLEIANAHPFFRLRMHTPFERLAEIILLLLLGPCPTQDWVMAHHPPQGVMSCTTVRREGTFGTTLVHDEATAANWACQGLGAWRPVRPTLP